MSQTKASYVCMTQNKALFLLIAEALVKKRNTRGMKEYMKTGLDTFSLFYLRVEDNILSYSESHGISQTYSIL